MSEEDRLREDPSHRARSGAGVALLAAAVVALALVALGVFLWLPDYLAGSDSAPTDRPTASPPPPVSPPAFAAPAPAPVPAPKPALGPASAAEQTSPATAALPPAVSPQAQAHEEEQTRLEALAERRRAEAAVDALGERAADRWAKAALDDIETTLELGRRAHATLAYADAQAYFAQAADAGEALLERWPQVLKQTLAQGASAYEARDAAAAKDAFALALAIDPDSELARTGLARSEALPAVLAAMNDADAALEAGDRASAEAALRAALAADSAFEPAQQKLAALQNQQRNDRFAAAMGRGYEALARDDLAAARKAFEAARSIDPQARAAGDALSDVATRERTREITTLRSALSAQEQAERWGDALATLNELDKRKLADPALTAARQRAERYRDANAKADALRADPAALAKAEGEAILASLAQALAEAPAPQPKFAAKVQSLKETRRILTTPVPVQVSSDGQTAVTVYRHGRLGTLESRAIELLPGQHIAVGERPGYRDVRVTFVVDPSAPRSVVDVRCTEPIR